MFSCNRRRGFYPQSIPKPQIFTHHPVGWMMEYAVKTFISKYMDGFRYPDFFGKLKDWLRSSFGAYTIIVVRGSGKVGKRVADLFSMAEIKYL